MCHLFPRITLAVVAWASMLPPPTALAAHAAEVKCYAPDGQTVANSSLVAPCNNLGITQSGIHSSCCQLQGDEDARDLCTATGLCLSAGIVRRGFCTDQTWKNPTCVGVCMDKQAGGTPTGFAQMTSCTDGTYCCGRNNLTCCGTTWAIKAPTIISSIVMTTITTTAAAVPAKQNIGATAGLGGALGVVLLAAAGAVIYLLRRIKTLKAANNYRSDPPPPMSAATSPGYPPSQQQQRSNLATPAGTANTEPEFATLKAMYNRTQSPELDGGSYTHHRVSELDGSTLIAATMQPLAGHGGRETADGDRRTVPT